MHITKQCIETDNAFPSFDKIQDRNLICLIYMIQRFNHISTVKPTNTKKRKKQKIKPT